MHELQEKQPETPRALDNHEQPEQGRWLIRASTQKSMADRRRGYTSDTRHLAKLAEKEHQHQKLVGALELRGFDVKPMIFAFGVGGTIYNQSVEDMRQLGFSTTAIPRTLNEVHLHSVPCATNIITQRRILDRQKLLQTQRQPPQTTNHMIIQPFHRGWRGL